MLYIYGEGGKQYIANKYEVKSAQNIMKWVKAYQAFGDEGLMRSKKNKSYTFEFKLSVAELYLTTEISYQKLALKVGINNPYLITRWVNDFRIAGPDALREKSKGCKPIMPNPKKIENIDENAKYLKQLEDENLKLTIENAYLKELRRLRLEEEAQNKKRVKRLIQQLGLQVKSYTRKSRKYSSYKLGYFSPVEYRLKCQAA